MRNLAPTPGGLWMCIVPDRVTVSATVRFGVFRPAAIRATPATCSDSIMPTLPGAILGRTSDPTHIELFAAMDTSECATGITNQGAWGPGQKLLSALLAVNAHSHNRQYLITRLVWMLSAKLLFCYSVADVAQCNQVVQVIGLEVGSKEAKRLFMVSREIVNRAAMLASVIISLKSLFSLCIPILAAIVDTAALPAGTIPACKAALTPFRVARPVTKVVGCNGPCLALDLCSTLIAS